MILYVLCGSWYYIYSSMYYVCVCYKFGIIFIAVYIMCVYVMNMVLMCIINYYFY